MIYEPGRGRRCPKVDRDGERAPSENHRSKYFQGRSDRRFSEIDLLEHVPGSARHGYVAKVLQTSLAVGLVLKKIDEIAPSCFRVYDDNDTFRLRAPMQQSQVPHAMQSRRAPERREQPADEDSPTAEGRGERRPRLVAASSTKRP